MTYLVEGLLILLLVSPVNILLHELSHALAVKFCGGELIKINLGTGKVLFKVRKIYVHQWYWNNGEFYFKNLKSESKLSQIIVFLSGPLSNLFFAIMLYLFKILIGSSELIDIFITWAFIVFISSMLPLSFGGRNSDGMQIYQILRTGSSIFITKEKAQNNA